MKGRQAQAFDPDTGNRCPRCNQYCRFAHPAGAFRTTGVAIAIRRTKPAALAFVNDFHDESEGRRNDPARFHDSAASTDWKIAP